MPIGTSEEGLVSENLLQFGWIERIFSSGSVELSINWAILCCFLATFYIICTRRYGPLRGPTSSSCGGLRPRLFFLPFGQKKSLLCCFGPFLAFFGVQL